MDVGRAVLGGLEQDGVDEADERDVGDPDVVLFLGQRVPGAEGLGGADELANGGEDVLARGDAELDRMPGREPQLVDAVQVRGLGDGNEQGVAAERVRHGDDALEDVQGDQARRLFVHVREGEVDERELVARGQDPGDAVARGDALLDERLREGAGLAGAPAHDGELVGRHELRGGEQICDQLGELVDAVLAAERRAQAAARRQDGAEDGGFLALVAHPIPRTRYRQQALRPLGGSAGEEDPPIEGDPACRA